MKLVFLIVHLKPIVHPSLSAWSESHYMTRSAMPTRTISSSQFSRAHSWWLCTFRVDYCLSTKVVHATLPLLWLKQKAGYPQYWGSHLPAHIIWITSGKIKELWGKISSNQDSEEVPPHGSIFADNRQKSWICVVLISWLRWSDGLGQWRPPLMSNPWGSQDRLESLQNLMCKKKKRWYFAHNSQGQPRRNFLSSHSPWIVSFFYAKYERYFQV